MKIYISIGLILLWINAFSNNRDSLIQVTQTDIPVENKISNLFSLARTSATIEEFYTFYYKGISLAESIDAHKSVIEFQIAEGNFYFDKQEDAKGMEIFINHLKKAESKQDSLAISKFNYSIGVYYFYKGDIENCIHNFETSIVSYPASEPILGKATSIMALGVVLQNTTRIEEAIRYQRQALKIKEDEGAISQLPVSLNNLAELHYQLKQYNEAYALLNRSIELSDSIGDVSAYYYALYLKGEMFVKEKKYTEAIPFIQPAIQFWESRNSWHDLPRAYKTLSDAYIGAKMPMDAMHYMHRYIDLKDSIFNIEKRNSANEVSAKFDSEKKELLLKQEREAKEFAQKEKLLNEKAEQLRFILFAAIGIILLINVFYFYKRYRTQLKDKELIALQKRELEARNHEIMDSIAYAKRIQAAILPSDIRMKKILPNSFIYYQPKDVVAGDFYWIEENDDAIYVAVADCTGHGVPGAMVSVVCNNSLNYVVRQLGEKNPSQILDKTRQLIKDEFNQSNENLRDGMDIALCKIKNEKLYFSGAHNPVWIIRNNELIEFKGDKQPIGKFEHEKPFTQKETRLEKNDILYIFSDGFADQFGGKKGKKFKYAALKELLISISQKTMHEQKLILEDTFEKWRGSLEQIDDVCVMGVKV